MCVFVQRPCTYVSYERVYGKTCSRTYTKCMMMALDVLASLSASACEHASNAIEKRSAAQNLGNGIASVGFAVTREA